ncbi:MAG: hypothetical protein A2X59_10870 [Nitrospirae bacterium GWC2_42_7]|nr:MAG: hypothetical protein A2X59_10870 [Nitrospirae bacterium GWC2_42_7]
MHILVEYTRDQGPVCYGISLFDQYSLSDSISKMLSINIDWYWMTYTSREAWPDNISAIRTITKLNSENLDVFSNDFLERGLDGYGKFIAVFGLNKNSESLNEDCFQDTIEKFAIYEQGPIQIVVIQLGDSPYEHVFIPHVIGEPTKRLLELWEITPEKIEKKYKYNRLKLAKLESIFNISSK